MDNDNDRSLDVHFYLDAGSTYTGGTFVTSWAADANNTRVSDTTGWLESTSPEWYITGVQLEVGEQATPFEHRSYGDELRRCQRYYQEETVSWILGVEGTRNTKLPFPHKVSMRAAPTSTLTGGSAANGALIGTTDVTADTTDFHFWLGTSGSLQNATFSSYTFKADAEL